METIKDGARLLQQLAIVSQRCAQSVHDRVKTRSFKPMKLVVLQIYVMNDLGDLTQTFAAAQAKSLEHRFERAIFAVMGKLGPKHVERNRALHRLAFSDKVKACAFVDEL